MRCRHCGTFNAEDDHRCQHCGRRLFAPVPVAATAAAPELQPEEAPPPQRADRPAPIGAARQPSLFADRSKVIPFEALAPARVRAGERQARRPAPGARAVSVSTQQRLDLHSAVPRRQTVRSDAPIAPRTDRVRAAALDGVFTITGIALFAAAFHFMGGRFEFTPKTAPGYAGALVALLVFYRLFWVVLGRGTAGMRILGVRILTFDGHEPHWGLRLVRFLAACLGVAALGLGFLWSLMDEEGLTWHDHISKTFPTSGSTFRRK